MKKNSDSLFLLIKSLSRNEKGYFKKRILQNINKQESNYILLFNAIDKQKEYDEEKIKTKLAKTTLVKHFNVSKRNLYWVILKNLRTYYSHFSIEAELHDMFRDAEIMLNNNLHRDCTILLQKILKIATENEFFGAMLETYYFTVRIKYYTDFKTLELNHAAQLKCVRSYENLLEYRRLRNKLALIPYVFDIENNKEYFQRFNEIIHHTLLSEPNKALSIRAKSYYYSIHSITSSLYLDTNSDNYEMNKEFVDELERKKANNIAWNHMYVEAVNLLLKTQLNLGKYSEFKITLNKLKSKQEKSPFIVVYAFVRSILNETAYFIKLGHHEEGLVLIKNHKKELLELETMKEHRDLQETLPIYLNCSIICYMNNKFLDSLRWIKMIEENQSDIRNDFELFIKIFNLIILYESKQSDLPDAIKSTIDAIEKHRKLFPIEKLIIEFIKEIIKSHDIIVRNLLFNELKNGILNIKNEPTSKKITQLFDFEAWVNSKIEKRSFVEIIKEKNKKAGN